MMAPQSDAQEPSGWRLVLGLGNPGAEYAGTRHNVGFDVLDLFAARRRLEWSFQGSVMEASWPETRTSLVKPLTYMNRSGSALRKLLQERGPFAPASIFVITDDFHLPLGGLRLRDSGSSGGHKGLLSLEESLASQGFPRLRIGIGSPAAEAGPVSAEDVVDFVLSPFSAAERLILEETLLSASWCAEDWVLGASLESLQARFNRRSPPAES
jgi:PTH1 family peptidyl-tRNA hydrolase